MSLVVRLRLLAVFLLACLVGRVDAQSVVWTSRTAPSYSSPTPGRVVVTPTGGRETLSDILQRRSYNPNPSMTTVHGAESRVILRDLLDKPFRPADVALNPPMHMDRAVTTRALSKAIYRALPVVGTALVVNDIIEASGCKLSLSNIIECQGRTEQRTMTPPDGAWCMYGQCWQSAQEAMGALLQNLNSQQVGTHIRFHSPEVVAVSPDGNTMEFRFKISGSDVVMVGGIQVLEKRADIYSPNYSATKQTGQRLVWDCIDQKNAAGECVQTPNENDWADRNEGKPGVKDKMGPPLPDLLDKMGADYDTEPPVIGGPAAAPGGRGSETRNQDGSITVVDRDRVITYDPDPAPKVAPWFEWGWKDTTTTYPPGTSPNPYVPPDPATGQPSVQPTPPGGTQTTTTTNITNSTSNYTTNNYNTTNNYTTPPGPVDIETCGLPGKPPCKIDETGTPTADPPEGVEGIFAGLKACVLTPSSCLPALPDLNWGFTLPTGCSPIPLGAYSEVGLPSFDICQYQPVIHDLMSMLWAAAGLFGAVRLVFRDSP